MTSCDEKRDTNCSTYGKDRYTVRNEYKVNGRPVLTDQIMATNLKVVAPVWGPLKTTRFCPKCGNSKLVKLISQNRKECTDCHTSIPWGLDPGQPSLF